MDPDAVLADIIDLVDAVLDDEADTYPDNLGADAVALAEGVKNLHVWLTRGGFLPAVWRGE